MTRLDKWDLRFIGLAEHISAWSKDHSTKVGAVITDSRHRIISMGYNGLSRSVKDLDERIKNRETKLALTIHAEENAILFSSKILDGCTIYVWPLPPCAGCASKIIQSGISRVVSVLPVGDVKERWQKDWDLASELYQEAGIIVDIESISNNW